MIHDPMIDRDSADQIAKNIDLTGRFLHEVFANPSLLDEIPDNANIVAMPADDPKLAQQNLMLALQMAERGETVVLQRIGIAVPAIPTWATNEQRSIILRPVTPHWPTQPPPEVNAIGR